MKSKKNFLDVKKIIIRLVIVLFIILTFTFIDYLTHQFSEEYAVPSRYFTNKIIYGTLIGFISLFFLQKFNYFAKGVLFSAIIAILLQIRYFIEGYSLKFVLEFLLFHFLMLAPISVLAFWLFRKYA